MLRTLLERHIVSNANISDVAKMTRIIMGMILDNFLVF